MKTKKILVEVVATAMIVAPLAQPARVFNVHALDTTPVVQTTTESPVLQNAEVIIPSNATVDQVTEILNKALIKNLDNVDTSSIEWEYQCEGKSTFASKNTEWGSINGFESTKKTLFGATTTTYTHPSLAANSDGSYQVRIKGNNNVVTVTKFAKLKSVIEVNQGVEVTLPYDEDANVNYAALKENIFNSVVKSSNPELTVNDVNIQYYASATNMGITTHAWVDLNGGKANLVDYQAISEGTQKIKISYNGNDTYYGAKEEVNITVKDRTPSDITVNEGQTIKLAYNDDATVNYDKVREDIFNKVVESSTPDLTVDDVTIQYYASTKTLGVPSQAWVALEGGKDVVNYPAISEGAQTIRIIYKGSKDYKPRTVETTINVVDRATVDVVTNEGPYNVSMKFNKDQSYDYDATAKAIYEAVIKSTNPELSFEDFKVEYNADPTSVLDVWYELSNSAALNLNKFKAGTWEIRLSWNATKEYKAGNIVVTVNVEDNRLESAVTLKEGTSVTYNMDAQEMKKALFNSIDFSKSTLPSKDELSVDDFTYEYYGTNVVAGNIDGGIKQWAPVEGGKVTLLDYPQMPAGEQKVRITYKGNSDYRPSTSGETTITVKKAKVKVSVHSTNIFADEELSKEFITINPADKFDVYTVYAGATSNVSLGLYLDLPARFTDNEAVIKVLDPVVEKVFGKSFTQMMQDGVTVGELRKLFSTQELLDLLEKLHIDTGTFGQILKVINKLPGIADNVRVGFGTPNRPGLYAVTAVTDNKNYETGVGIGALLVKQHVKGVKLIWNQKLTKISKEEAQNFDFKATVTYNGEAVSDENVHYLYTGVQSNLKPYSSTTKAPTEPGVYTMTAVTVGGNYQAAPIIRTFTITK